MNNPYYDAKKTCVHVCNQCYPKLLGVSICKKIACQVLLVNEEFVIHLN